MANYKADHTIRFAKRFAALLVHFISSQQILVGVSLLLAASLFQYRTGRLNLDALNSNVLGVVFPYIWVICLCAAYYALVATRDVYKELLAEMNANRPHIHLPAGPTIVSAIKPSLFRVAAPALLIFALLLTVAVGSLTYSGTGLISSRLDLNVRPPRSIEGEREFLRLINLPIPVPSRIETHKYKNTPERKALPSEAAL